MDLFSALWLPIFAASVFVFIASSILHMVTPLHKGDYKKLAGEDQVLRVTGAIAVLAYAATPLYESIWKGQSWATTFRFIIGAVIYGLATAGTFGWLWPGM